ncbi:MAG TPA: hypothetical protein DCY40_08415 [Actinobacteria bacterium]|nr:hypothetical protein [Actinomycetota bacterium]
MAPSAPVVTPAKERSRMWAVLPMIAAVGLGASVFFPWLEAFGTTVNAMDIRLDSSWTDLVDFELDGAWLGPVVLAIAVLGFLMILLRSVPAVFYRIVGIVAIAVVAMFFRAAIAGDGFEFVAWGAYAAAGFSLLMLIPRN